MNKFFNTLIQENPERFVMIFYLILKIFKLFILSVRSEVITTFSLIFSDIEILLFPLIFQFCNRK